MKKIWNIIHRSTGIRRDVEAGRHDVHCSFVREVEPDRVIDFSMSPADARALAEKLMYNANRAEALNDR